MTQIYEQLPSVFNVAAYFIEGNLYRGNAERAAFYHQDETYTYRKVRSYVRRAAGLLSDLGLERENRVAILLPDSPEFVFAFWGAIWVGAVPVPINTGCTLDDIQYILQDCRARVLLTTNAWLEKLAPIQSKFLCHTLLTDGQEPFRSLLDSTTSEPTPAETSGDEPAFWLYTSGSTGRPKGVLHLHQSMVVCSELYGKNTLGLREDDIVYSVAKMPFAYGLGNTLYMPMAVGAAAVLSDAPSAFDVIDDIHRYRPTILHGIPAMYAAMLAAHEITPLDVSSLRLCASAAEQLPRTIWHKWQETYGTNIYEGIGTTELLHIFLSNRPGECRPGSSGRPVAGYSVQVVDENGLPLAPGEVGSLQVRGKSLMLGYWNRLRETREALYGETMLTGDNYLCDEDGYFCFMGRKDDFFKVNGQWVSPFEIEDVLLRHDSVLDVAAVPESDGGEHLTQVVAYISLKSGFSESPELEDSIRKFAKSHLPHFKAPKTIQFLADLPRTPTGKIHRKALKTKPLAVTS